MEEKRWMQVQFSSYVPVRKIGFEIKTGGVFAIEDGLVDYNNDADESLINA